jgi:hypothetical protein
MIYLRQSTASQEVLLGPFVDSTDGNTAETGLTIANTDIKVFKAGATTLANKNSGGATHISAGNYYAVLDATDTDTVGSGAIIVQVSGALAVRLDFHVLEEAVFDAIYAASATGYLQPTVAGRTLDVASTGEAGIDINNISALTAGPLALFGIIESGTAQSATATTLVGRAAATNDIVKAGHTLFVHDSTLGYWQSVMVDSVSGDTFTIAAWPVATPAATITYLVMGTPVSSSATPIPANVTQIGGDTQSATDLKDFADAGYDPSTNKVQGVVLTDTATTLTNLPAITANWLTAAGTAPDFGTELAAAVNQYQLPDSYAADGAQPTVAQALLTTLQVLTEAVVSGSDILIKKPDGTTTAVTITCSPSVAAATSRTRSA